jgi:hypothetical protein
MVPNPKPVDLSEELDELRRAFAEGRAAFERGEGIEMTPDELMDGIEKELGVDDPCRRVANAGARPGRPPRCARPCASQHCSRGPAPVGLDSFPDHAAKNRLADGANSARATITWGTIVGRMGYRDVLTLHPETVQDLELSAPRRLDEAWELWLANRPHTAIYLAGLAAEMYLKTACFFVGGAAPATQVDAVFTPLASRRYRPPFKTDWESGHGLWFWSQELLARRAQLNKPPTPRRFLHVLAALYVDWFIGMRYRPGSASANDAATFITNVDWIAHNHAKLRS